MAIITNAWKKCSDKIQEFLLWAKSELEQLDKVAIREEIDDVLQDGLQQLVREPAGRAMIEKMVKDGVFQNPPSANKDST